LQWAGAAGEHPSGQSTLTPAQLTSVEPFAEIGGRVFQLHREIVQRHRHCRDVERTSGA
jgi:hypothetical protein